MEPMLNDTPEPLGLLAELSHTLRQALAILGLAAILALLVNMVRPNGLRLVADKPYETLVPCPESGGPVTALTASEAMADASGTMFVDARDVAAFATRHHPAAVSVPYDYLDPTPPEALRALARDLSKSGVHRVVVYGDGGSADSGEQLAKEISASGIKNVAFVRGGAPALFGGTGGAP